MSERAFPDSHAHLPLVAEELGELELRAVMEAYAEAWEGEEGEGRPLLVDIGTEPGDLRPRRSRLRASFRSARPSSPGEAPFLRLSAGVWPSEEALADPARALRELEREMAADAAAGGSLAAIGECGLDYRRMNGSRERQLELFAGQAELARRLGLPLIVHSREAFEDSFAAIEDAALGSPVLIHCFGYGPAEARAFLGLGCFLSFAGNLTYKKAGALREACALVPPDRLLLETDSPYMSPEPRRGRPCSPLDVARSYAAAAELRGSGARELELEVSANAWKLFGGPARP
ncbi:MAG TPA: TatD family hydrolase [Spirochaetia bacterium]|nr:TatD family hydrolase [Spirochaetia bacterium]